MTDHKLSVLATLQKKKTDIPKEYLETKNRCIYDRSKNEQDITFYNAIKGGVDMVNQMAAMYGTLKNSRC